MTKKYDLEHLNWLQNTNQSLKSLEGKNIEVWDILHLPDADVLSQWAQHFRGHYGSIEEIDYLRGGTKYTRAEYLNKLKFPDKSTRPGPSIRSGDFGETLIADFLEYIMGYWVPRTRYDRKAVRNESTKGADTLAFKIHDETVDHADDTLTIFEVKAKLSGKKPQPTLQKAIDDSVKDEIRKAESLNALKHRFYIDKDFQSAERVSRFQNVEDRPYVEKNGAAAVLNTDVFDANMVSQSKTRDHPNKANLLLIVFRGENLMDLVHELYRRAADEA